VLVFQCWSVLFTQQNGEKMTTEKWTIERFQRWVQWSAGCGLQGQYYEQLKEYDPTLAELYRESCVADNKLSNYCRTKLEGK
jgi:hypothetical protein